MAITRSQQAKQMLQDGGMLVKPGFGGIRQGYRGDAAAASAAASGNMGGRSDPGPQGDVGDGPATGAPSRGMLEELERQRLEKAPDVKSKSKLSFLDFIPGIGTARRIASMFGPINNLDFFNQKVAPAGKFKGTGFYDYMDQRQAGLIDAYGNPIDQDNDNDNNYVPPTFAQTQAPAGIPAAVQPMQTMDLNRIAYRLMADGGFIDDEDEPRQAYGLGSLVKKVVKKATTIPRKVFKTVKKVAKSPTGRLLLAVAAPYALGPAMASSAALSGFTAAQKAALISGATTGITQLASGEDLDLKDIALSAAIGGTSAKMFPGNIPGKATPQGVSGSNKALFTSDAAMRGTGFGGNIVDEVALTGTSDPSKFTAFTKAVTNPQGIGQAKESTGILQTLKDFGTKIKDSKLTDIIKTDGKISPTKSILLASALSGLAAKKNQEDEFSEVDRGPGIDIAAIRRRPFDFMAPRFAGSQFDFYNTAAAEGGRIGYQKGSKEPVAKKVMPLLDLDGQEMDLRAEGGFVPIGRMEKADDVPARLSKNEFVFTADAVRNAGNGNVDKGAEVMYNMMKNLEDGGNVSEESQGLEGARDMFQTAQRLQEII